eukprot:CAMPEP_0202867314 /NCGR_PEP_ID=MMETSP1391-20130828/9177_1 /ASSEMBLY_ACC=CAM_ASM_000867 /TAXON_ID=1034604 /ORGANISM="Chlamydomonas leiostraca, Strain SAG 11-49" /LENGTH=86 /DNA_ID=CAMNT_0049547349 /DNA_START=443 /DNA_END=702 /DNA_ORIENTATION=+
MAGGAEQSVDLEAWRTWRTCLGAEQTRDGACVTRGTPCTLHIGLGAAAEACRETAVAAVAAHARAWTRRCGSVGDLQVLIRVRLMG